MITQRSISLLCREFSTYELDGANYIVKIRSDKVGLLDMSKIDELYELGYRQTKEKTEELKK